MAKGIAEVPKLATDFLERHLIHDLNRSPLTIVSYSQTLQMFLPFCAGRCNKRPDDLDVADLTPELVLDFLNDRERCGNCPRTRNQRLHALRTFFRYAAFRLPKVSQQAARVGLIQSKRTIRSRLTYLSVEEMGAIVSSIGTATVMDRRDRALLMLGFWSGMRAAELLGLTSATVVLGLKPHVTILGKGRKLRTLPLGRAEARALSEWASHRPKNAITFFCNSVGDPLTREGLAYILGKYVARATVPCPSLARKHVTPHTMRHSCAMRIMKATRDYRQVSFWLGHESIQSTQIYIQADQELVREIANEHPALNIKYGTYKAADVDIVTRLKDAAKLRRKTEVTAMNALPVGAVPHSERRTRRSSRPVQA